MLRRRRLHPVALCSVFIALLCRVPSAAAAELEAQVRDASGKPLPDAVLYLQPVGEAAPVPPGASAIIDQVNKEFVPRVIAVTRGTRVSFPNRDNIRHHVYSFSEARSFELPLYAGTPADPVAFDTPGVVTLGCNIHDWMRGYVLVLDTPYFGSSGADGNVRLGAPASTGYRMMAWHPELPQALPLDAGSVVLSEDQTTRVALTLELQPVLRIRRAPSARRNDGY